MEVGLPVSPEEFAASPVLFTEGGDELPRRPLVEVDMSVIAGKTPDMVKVELRKKYDAPVVAYVLRQHFSSKGAGKRMSVVELGELMRPDDHVSDSALIKDFKRLLKQAERYKIVIS